jgi:GTP pyrophosphokinase
LHTTVLTNNNQIVEIQIKTQEMHEYSEFGIASHWMYQLNKTKANYIKRKEISQKNTLLKDLKTANFQKQDNESMFETLVNDILAEQIYVITPKGDILGLPKGSTPIDFAYKIHTDIGNHCEMAKINNQAVPLNHPLTSGDIVDIITNKNKKPSRAWLEFVKMSETKKKIIDSL